MRDENVGFGVRVGASVLATASCYALYKYFRGGKGSGIGSRSVTSSAGGGAAAYETSKAVDEYLQFHFGAEQDVLPYEFGPTHALSFTARCAALCERYCWVLQDFTGEYGDTTALDIGCAVGGSTFEMAKSFTNAMGIDYSQAFVDAANKMKETGSMTYSCLVEGEIEEQKLAKIPEGIDRAGVRFMQGDACNLPQDLLPVDCILAANLLCRLPNPMAFLNRLPSLLKPRGSVVLVSPYSWLHSWTPKKKWIGGYVEESKTGTGVESVRSAQSLSNVMQGLGFELVHQEDMPFLIREHVRKFQWGVSHATVWRKPAQ